MHYLLTFFLLKRNSPVSLIDCCFALAIGLFIWSIVVIINRFASNRFAQKIFMSIPPSITLLTTGDREAFDNFPNRRNGYIASLISLVIIGISSVGINIVSSYLYDYATKSH